MEQDRLARMVRWGFTDLHLRIEWEELTDVSPIIKQVCEDYVKDFTLKKEVLSQRLKEGKKSGLFLYSDLTGTAKTAVVHQIAKDLLNRPKFGIRKMRYIGAIEMFYELKSTFRSDGGMNESDVIKSLMEADLLIIDDFDKVNKWTPYERERATLILDKRYSSLKSTIFTANSSIDEMKQKGLVEPHLYSRLVQMCQEVHFESKQDFRTKSRISIKTKKKFE